MKAEMLVLLIAVAIYGSLMIGTVVVAINTHFSGKQMVKDNLESGMDKNNRVEVKK